MLKARPLTGTAELRREIEAIRHRHCFQRPLPTDAREKVQAMRGSLYQAAVDEKGKQPFDIKAHRGGLLDIEFMVQWAQLSRQTEDLEGRSTFALLRHLVGEEAWSGLDGDYRWLRRLELRLGIAGQGRQLPSTRRKRESLARQMGLQGEDVVEQFDRQLQRIRQRVQRAWRSVIGPGEGAR